MANAASIYANDLGTPGEGLMKPQSTPRLRLNSLKAVIVDRIFFKRSKARSFGNAAKQLHVAPDWNGVFAREDVVLVLRTAGVCGVWLQLPGKKRMAGTYTTGKPAQTQSETSELQFMDGG